MTTKESAVTRFRKEYRLAYKDILPPSVLEEGNAWFENFLIEEIDSAKRGLIERIEGEIDSLGLLFSEPSKSGSREMDGWYNHALLDVKKFLSSLKDNLLS